MNHLYQLHKDKQTYTIKVRPSKSHVGLLKIYYQYPAIAPNWLKIASCSLEDDLEQIIMLYFGNKGSLTLLA